jgi:DNA polymerase-3 subunit delta'
VIIDDANMMNRNGQNALLKILEEPPKKALLLLVTHGAGGLLPTIRSRCRFVGFKPLDDNDLFILLNKASETSVMNDDKYLLSALSDGSAGQAIELIEAGGADNLYNILGLFEDVMVASRNQIDKFALTYGKSGDAKSVRQFVFILNWWFETLIYMAAQGQTRLTIGTHTLHIPQGYDLSKLLSRHEDVAEHINTCINGNLDKRYMIYKALRIIQE